MPAQTDLTRAERIAALQMAHSAEYLRTPLPDGTVKLQLAFPDGTLLGAIGTDTGDALTKLESKVAAFVAAGGA